MAKIIYHCYGGSHSSVTAAGIHLGILPRKRVANTAELLGVPYYDEYQPVTHGRLRFIGRDVLGNEVFVLGKRTAGPDTTIFLHNIAELFDCGEEIYPVDTTFPVNPLMVIGGFLSRGLNLVSLGRPIVIYGTKIAYPFLAEIAADVFKTVKKNPAPSRCTLSLPERRFLFYICPAHDRLSLLLAGLHLNPDIGDLELLNWITSLEFSGELGTLQYLGKADNYELYLVGAGREPEIMARTLRETRTLMKIPQLSLCIVYLQQPTSLLLKGIGKLRNFLSSKSGVLCWLEKLLLRGFVEKRRQEAYVIKTSLLEGILD
ncbi:DUF3189 family protein [Syntrophaceticus schinkii]|jgi:hypothetical protein|uniref:DUF3189 family protein n=1 Tax=Syntrophaceticus schinkii TaxID=499207 RepID=A0A0B7MM68_9FIRM|nr:DUF3189 family protein [Syntrophaceticus schinkii]CEO89076.1 hypothetical protein SSCH_360014 [Syntrophaceticus schinkii]